MVSHMSFAQSQQEKALVELRNPLLLTQVQQAAQVFATHAASTASLAVPLTHPLLAVARPECLVDGLKVTLCLPIALDVNSTMDNVLSAQVRPPAELQSMAAPVVQLMAALRQQQNCRTELWVNVQFILLPRKEAAAKVGTSSSSSGLITNHFPVAAAAAAATMPRGNEEAGSWPWDPPTVTLHSRSQCGVRSDTLKEMVQCLPAWDDDVGGLVRVGPITLPLVLQSPGRLKFSC